MLNLPFSFQFLLQRAIKSVFGVDAQEPRPVRALFYRDRRPVGKGHINMSIDAERCLMWCRYR